MYIGKRHSKYSYIAKNVGPDLIYLTRLKLYERLVKGRKRGKNDSGKMYCYITNARLSIIN